MIRYEDAIRIGRSLMGTPYSELDCINLIKKVIRTAPGGVPKYTTAGTNSLWKSNTLLIQPGISSAGRGREKKYP